MKCWDRPDGIMLTIRIPIVDIKNLNIIENEMALVKTEQNSLLMYVNPRLFTEGILYLYSREDLKDVRIQFVMFNDTKDDVDIYTKNVWLNNHPVGSGGDILMLTTNDKLLIEMSGVTVASLLDEYVESVLLWKITESEKG